MYGVSVFARRPGVDVTAVLDRFTGAPAYLEVTIGSLRASGFEVYPTGVNPDHYDVQLVSGTAEDGLIALRAESVDAARRLLTVGGALRPNPAYAGDG